MAYNPDIQCRCTIIRGKSISRMDDYLPVYAEILNEICPIPTENFAESFDKKLSHYIDDNKTIKNHRTENVDKLLGMIFEKDGIIYLSERTLKFIENNDQPAFFKSVCFRFQQPNGSQKINTTIKKIQNGINFKPYHFVLSLLKEAQKQNVILTRDEIAYYVLNAMQVLQNKVSINEVLSVILSDREKGLIKKVNTSKNYAWSYQHINEQFDYLKLANLIRVEKQNIRINQKENTVIDYFIKNLNTPLSINFSGYDLSDKNISKIIELEWQNYFGQLPAIEEEKFRTSIDSLDLISTQIEQLTTHVKSTAEIGDEGESFVLQIEKDLVKAFNPRLVNKVNYHGKMRGLGYDITSIEANRNPKNPEFFRYIEVKATKRVNAPNFTDIYDSISLTRNEWIAAEQHANHFYIYRVYFTNQGTFISIINDPVKKNNEGALYATPTIYRIEFNDSAIDEKLNY